MERARPAWLRRLAALGVILIVLQTSVIVLVNRWIDPLRTADGGTSLDAFVANIPWDRAFVPHAQREGGNRTMHLTFPDGSETELVYRSSLRLAERGALPIATTRVADSAHGRYPIGFSFAPGMTLGVDEPWHTRSGVEIGPGRTRWGHRIDGRRTFSAWHHLFFYRLPGWNLNMVFPPGLTEDEAIAKADMHEAADGFPVLELRSPVGFAGPMAIVLGYGAPPEGMSPGTVTIQIAADGCDPALDFERRPVARRCVGEPGAQLLIEARGPEAFVHDAFDGVTARDIRIVP